MEYSNKNNQKENIGAIVVLYNPDIQALNKSLDILAKQVSLLCLVDNSTESHKEQINLTAHSVYVPLYKNIGIAAAQNKGLQILQDAGIDYALFSDQDSLAANDTAQKLLWGYKQLAAMGLKVAGTGTRAIHATTGRPYPSKSKEEKPFDLSDGHSSTQATECSYIRSSISLVPMTRFSEVGGFDEELFIDGVDNEWCWRAHTHGYKSYIIENATIRHNLGEGDRKLLTKDIAISSSFRIYFQYRNYLWLCRRNYVPLWWKRKHLVKYLVKAFYYPLFVSPRQAFVKGIAKGIFNGIFHSQQKKYNI